MKKILIIAFVVMICTVLSACKFVTDRGENLPQTEPPVTDPVQTEPPQTEPLTETTTTAPAVTYREFDKKLSDMSDSSAYFMDLPQFMNEEQGTAFANAHYLVAQSLFESSMGLTAENGRVDLLLNGDTPVQFMRTGVDYYSFDRYVRSVFTDDLAEGLFLGDYTYRNIDGELVVAESARGSNIFYVGRTFELVSSDDNELKFKVIGYYSQIGVLTEEEFNELPPEEREWTEEFDITIVNTADGWKVSQFNFWL